VKPKLLVIELWGLGDVVMAIPFVRAAMAEFAVTLVAKSYALDLRARFFPDVEVRPLQAPWTAFRRKYWLHTWCWGELWRFRQEMRQRAFDIGVSGRWDPRDHFLLWHTGARARLGFPRLGSQVFLTQPLTLSHRLAHRRENWRVAGEALGLKVLGEPAGCVSVAASRGYLLMHTGAAQPVRIWPLERFQRLVQRLRERGCLVRIACDADQLDWWCHAGEPDVATPRSVAELLVLIEGASRFIGNDSGPGHLAAACGVPTFTVFGPGVPERIAPTHPQAAWIEGKPCRYKPCFDSCRMPEPICMTGLSEEEVCERLLPFLERPLAGGSAAERPTDRKTPVT
jgi:heptosyltransferase-2